MHLRGVCLLLLAGVIVTWAGLTRELLFVLFEKKKTFLKTKRPIDFLIRVE